MKEARIEGIEKEKGEHYRIEDEDEGNEKFNAEG